MKPIFTKGQLITWKEDRGFGFIASAGDGPDVFLHISVLPQDSRRPKVGDTILYQRVITPKGKVRAAKAAIQGVTSKLQISDQQKLQKQKKNRTATPPAVRASSKSRTNSRQKLPNTQVIGILVGLATLSILTLAIAKNIFHKSLEPVAAVPSEPAAVIPKPECKVKGNVSISTGRKLYHIPGMEDYSSTKISPEHGERWFCSEAEAINNGWRKAPR